MSNVLDTNVKQFWWQLFTNLALLVTKPQRRTSKNLIFRSNKTIKLIFFQSICWSCYTTENPCSKCVIEGQLNSPVNSDDDENLSEENTNKTNCDTSQQTSKPSHSESESLLLVGEEEQNYDSHLEVDSPNKDNNEESSDRASTIHSRLEPVSPMSSVLQSQTSVNKDVDSSRFTSSPMLDDDADSDSCEDLLQYHTQKKSGHKNTSNSTSFKSESIFLFF
jgi:hypothetical protein